MYVPSVVEDTIFKIDLKVVLFTSFFILVAAIYMGVLILSHNPRDAFLEELEYVTIDGKGGHLREPLENTKDEHKDKIILSVVVPSYNETKRIRRMLEEAIEHLQVAYKNQWEIVIVDDGSSDGTTDYCLKLSAEEFNLKPHQLKIVKLLKNRGKGGAVKQGLLHVEGKYALFADADGASKFSNVNKLIEQVQKIENGASASKKSPALAIGSRAHMVDTDAVVKRSFIRNFLMYGFHGFVYIFGVKSIKDTQCGFKLFNRAAINEIIPYMHTEGWIFDVEILMLAMRKNIPIKEVAITWHEVDGSKMMLARDSINMAKDLITIRMAYFLGIYNDKKVC